MGHFHSKNQQNLHTIARKNSSISIKHHSSFRYINGRRFHNDDNSMYFLPNDEEEGNKFHHTLFNNDYHI
jgi:hypothetical protein